MINSFKDKTTKTLFEIGSHKRIPPDITRRCLKRLDQLNAAATLEDMRFPPSNRLEKLQGHTPDRYSVRINNQFRLTFEWAGDGADSVCIEDYH